MVAIDFNSASHVYYQSAQSKLLNSYFVDLIEAVGEYGAIKNLNEILKAEKLNTVTLLQDSDKRTFALYYRLLGTLHQIGTTPGIGLRLGTFDNLSKFGIYGYAMLACSNYAQFSAVARRIFKAIYQNIDANVQIQTKQIRISYMPMLPVSYGYTPIMEQIITTAFSLFKNLFGKNLPWNHCEVRLSYAPPSYVQLYKDCIPCKITFNQAQTELVLPLGWQDLPIASGDETLSLIVGEQFKTMLNGLDSQNRLADRIRQDLYYSLGNRMLGAQDVAKKYNMTERTLRNRLTAEDTSFRQLVAEVRMNLATRYLVETTLSIQEIAHLLGYAQTQNFYYFFGQQLNVTPEKFRASKRSAS
ncbi:helix-turn-helix transcriptional regulator [Rhodoferax lacus]|nr:AraC family transcriptional regulator [Rhodoferax lacus]